MKVVFGSVGLHRDPEEDETALEHGWMFWVGTLFILIVLQIYLATDLSYISLFPSRLMEVITAEQIYCQLL